MKKVKDHYFHKAKKDGFAARAVYKLEEIDQKHHLLKRGYRVLDLGCAPGSWLQFIAKKIGNEGKAVGIDLSPITVKLPSNVNVIQGDIFDWKPEGELAEPYDLIVSDMAPKTTGIVSVDAQRSFNLCEQALSMASIHLKPGGTLLVKAFQGGPFQELRQLFQQQYAQVKICKPKSSRKESVELFLLGLGKKELTSS